MLIRRFCGLVRGVVLIASIGACFAAVPAQAGSQACEGRSNDTFRKLLQCVTVDGVLEHLAAFQAIADDNDGIRVSGAPGYDDSVSYVAEKLEAAGYAVEIQPFTFNAFIELSTPSLQQLAPALYLNFDMIASPNFVYSVYDGSGDAFGLAGPEGSAAIEDFFADFYDDAGAPFLPTQISFRSDYAGFFDSGIPFGGLFTGAEGIKTPEQAALWGGVAGSPYDPCYHLACDTSANVSQQALSLNAKAAAAATLQYAMNTETINGVGGRGNFGTLARDAAGKPIFETRLEVGTVADQAIR